MKHSPAPLIIAGVVWNVAVNVGKKVGDGCNGIVGKKVGDGRNVFVGFNVCIGGLV